MTEPGVDEIGHRSQGRPRRGRRGWTHWALLATNCIVILGCFTVAGFVLVSRHYGNSITRVELPTFDEPSDAPSGSTAPPATDATGQTIEPPPGTGPTETFPAADPEALNFLITGADNNDCIDPDSPYAGAFGDRSGNRTDTIMVLRVDPERHLGAMLSFPRDLWVPIAGRGNKDRINSAYTRDDPDRLLETIYDLTGITVDHYVQVDFCAFQKVVDAVGGVAVPFEYPATDDNTGLYVPEPGCFTFSGDHALAYVRSRHYLYMDEGGVWKEDPFSDIGRISRQQDFVRRVLSAALDAGFNPGVAREIVEAVRDYISVDTNLTPGRMLEIAGILQDFEPGAMATYQVYGEPADVGGNKVIVPKLDGTRMQSILAIFTGDAPLPEPPDNATETTEPGSTDTTAPVGETDGSTVEPGPAGPNENVQGIVPPEDMEC